MIVAKQKSLEEIRKMIESYQRVLILGCGTCVAVCFAGGDKEVGVLAASLRLADKISGREGVFSEHTVERQCEWEFLDKVGEKIKNIDAILSLGCGVGVQMVAERFPNIPVLPGVNTSFIGAPKEGGVWDEMCTACGDCRLAETAGICPITRCAKNLLNGPCGGSVNGKCEVSPETPCAWQLIYDRLSALGLLHLMEEIRPAKDWSTSHSRGPRKIVREDLKPVKEAAPKR